MAPLIEARPHARPVAYIDMLKGFKSDIKCYGPFTQIMADIHWHDTHVQGYAHPGNRLDFLPEYRDIAENYFCRKPRAVQADAPRIASAHSLGAFLLLEILSDEDKAQVFAQTYDGLVLANPFTGDRYHDRRLCREFSQWIGRDHPAGKTLLERLFTTVADDPYEIPSHRQSLMLHDEAGAVFAKIIANGGLAGAVKDIPVVMLTGTHDPVCDNEKTQALARVIGAQYREFPTGHNALLECHEAQNFYIQALREFSANALRHRAEPSAPGPFAFAA